VVLDDLSGLGLPVAGGYADLDPGGRPGLGARAHAESGVPVIGVAKSRLGTATHAVPVVRGSSLRPLFVTRGRDAPPAWHEPQETLVSSHFTAGARRSYSA
jgi:hypothetical protein